MPITGAQREWGGAFFTDTVKELPGQVRDVMTDPETRDRLQRMPAADAFHELKRLLGLMQFTVLEAWGFGDETAQAIYETIDTLATLPTDPDPSDVTRDREPSAGRDVAQVAAWLGHADPGFTLRTYVHLMDNGMGDAAFLDTAVTIAAPEPDAFPAAV